MTNPYGEDYVDRQLGAAFDDTLANNANRYWGGDPSDTGPAQEADDPGPQLAAPGWGAPSEGNPYATNFVDEEPVVEPVEAAGQALAAPTPPPLWPTPPGPATPGPVWPATAPQQGHGGPKR